MKLGRAKSPRKQKSTKAVFVLMIGDEGAILLQLQGKQVVKRIFAASPEKEQLRAMDEALKASPKTPLMLLVDMMDQSYVRQTLPPVSSFNVGKIVRRRLQKDFSNDDIKGYVIFGREKTGRRDWNYMMASLANPPVLQKWIDFAVERKNPFRGLGLVPLEAQPLIKAIEAKELASAGKDAKATDWHVLVSHHKVGGFRQIVLKNQQLVFTRLAQMVGEPTPEVIAGNIEQELLNTLEYLKRLGLQDTNGLTVSIIGSEEIKQTFEPKSIRSSQCHFYTPHEIATLLGMEEIAKPEDHFGDLVIAGFIGKRRKLLLTLFTTYTRQIARIMKYLLMARSAAALAALGIVAWAGMTVISWMEIQEKTEELKKTRTSLNAQFNAELKNKDSLPDKINLYTDVTNLFRYYYKPSLDPLVFANNLPQALDSLAVVKSYHWTLTSPAGSINDEDKRQITADIETVLLAPQEPRDVFVNNAQTLVKNVKKAFAEYDVSNSDIPGILSDSKELKTVFSENGATSSQSDSLNSIIKFIVKGPLKTPPATNQPPGIPQPPPTR